MMKTVFNTLLVAAFAASAFAQSPAPAPARTAAPAAAPGVVAAPAAVAAPVASGDVVTGKAAWYGNKFNGRKTASGQRFNAGLLTAASNTLPFGTWVKVTNVKNKKSVTVRINDRGPQQADRIIDVTRAAAARLGMLKSGLAEVELKVMGTAKGGAKAMKKKAKKA
jgi:rare lipoprotein A